MICKTEKNDSAHLPRCSYPTKSYVARQLSQLFPFHSPKRFPSLNCFRGLLFRLFPGFSMSVNPFKKHPVRSFFVNKNIAGHGTRQNHSFFSVCGKSHSGIIPQSAFASNQRSEIGSQRPFTDQPFPFWLLAPCSSRVRAPAFEH